MNPAQPSPEVTVFGGRWAFGLGAALLLGFAAVTAVAIHDKAHLSSLETVTEPTAVGDKSFYTPGAALHPMHPSTDKPIQAFDVNMLKTGMDDTHTYFIYTPAKAPAQNGVPVRYVKIADGQYLQVLP